jgi:hypothetical protein
MKNLFKTLIAVAIVSVTVQSCKKGEEDGALSLRSRKSRFAGEWKVDSNIGTNTFTVTPPTGSASSSTWTLTETGGTIKLVESSTSNGTTVSTTTDGTVSEHTYTIEKDGTFSHTYKFTITEIRDNSQSGLTDKRTTVTIADITEEGEWNFTGGIGEAKNKEHVVLSVTSHKENRNETTTSIFGFGGTTTTDTDTESSSTTTTWAPNENTMIWQLVMLKNKEMKASVKGDTKSSGSSTSTNGGSSTTDQNDVVTSTGSYEMEFTQE